MDSSFKNELKSISLPTKGDSQIVNITEKVQNFLSTIKAQKGLVTVSVVGSTAGITTMEYESGLEKDIPEMLDKIAPPGKYHHDDMPHHYLKI